MSERSDLNLFSTATKAETLRYVCVCVFPAATKVAAVEFQKAR